MDGASAGKVVIVTGAASGICRVTLQAFVRAGARGVIADVNQERGRQVADDLRAEGGEAMYTIVEMSDEEWDFQVDTQLRAVFLTCRAAARQMIRQGRGGRIINFGSTGGLVVRVRSAAHGASKAGVVHFTKVLALELGPYHITANVVAPGLTDIRAVSDSYPMDDYIGRFVQEVPLGRLADPQEIADVVLFVASDQARFVTAQAIYVDGGYSAGKLSIDGGHRVVLAPDRTSR